MKRIFKIFLLFITFCLFFIFIAVLKIIKNAPNVNDIDFYKNTDITITDTNDNIINTSNYYNKHVSLQHINQNLINALISIEDEHYFSHSGINFTRILKAMYKNITSQSFSEGASTIDQQLLKNYVLSSDKTLNRKIQEIYLANRLENLYSKEQILEFYLNNILMGDNVYGVYDASLYYFDKNVKDLTVDEAATLAGLIQLPNYYSPYKNLDECILRRNLVLERMYESRYITKNELNLYTQIDLSSKLKKSSIFTKENYYNNYLDYISTYDFKNSSKVTLYMDNTIQRELYDIAKDKYNYINDDKLKLAIVLLDNKTGGILGMIGNRDSNMRVLNYATEKKQMASTMKPIIDYAPAFEYLNLSPGTIVLDEPYKYSDSTPLKNWDNLYKGNISIRKALRESRNIPALKIFKMVDNESRINVLNNLGLYPNNPIYESEALGAGANTYSLLEICNAYLAFANMGGFIKATPIKKISGSEYYKHNTLKTQAIKKTTAFFINNILHDVFKGSKYDLKNTYLMAKTGQNNYDTETIKKYNIPYGATRDSYVIAYTKSLTLGIWVGYDYVSDKTYLDSYKTQLPRLLMKHILSKFSKDNEFYDIPYGIEIKNICQIDDDIYLSNNGYYEYFKVGYSPNEYYKTNNYEEV